MTTTTAPDGRKILAHRAQGGRKVALAWSEPAGRLTVEVFDDLAGHGYELEVSGADAYRVFDDPDAHALAAGIPLPVRPLPRIQFRAAPAEVTLRPAA
jgi:hypothetical protein